tara:strand:- start:1434 stop:1772 length:339 start_codon:yes stop_codon:yes gene_type:complete
MARVSRRSRGSVARRSRRARGSVARRSRRARGSVARRTRRVRRSASRGRRAQGPGSVFTKTGKLIRRTGKALRGVYKRMETSADPPDVEVSNGLYNSKTGKTRPLHLGPSPF